MISVLTRYGLSEGRPVIGRLERIVGWVVFSFGVSKCNGFVLLSDVSSSSALDVNPIICYNLQSLFCNAVVRLSKICNVREVIVSTEPN